MSCFFIDFFFFFFLLSPAPSLSFIIILDLFGCYFKKFSHYVECCINIGLVDRDDYVIFFFILLCNFVFCRIYCFRNNGAIMLMIKQITIALVLMSLLVGSSWNIDASRQSSQPKQQRSQKISAGTVAAAVADSQSSKLKVREKRFINPFNKLVSLWNALTHIYSLYTEVS